MAQPLVFGPFRISHFAGQPWPNPLFGVAFIANVMTGIIPAMRKFRESNSGRKALRSERL